MRKLKKELFLRESSSKKSFTHVNFYFVLTKISIFAWNCAPK